jgi:CYTH domain-containing protein
MGIEIERKFLVDHKKWEMVDKPAGTHYAQGYLLAENGRTVRVRIAEKAAWLNLKCKSTNLTRAEFEYEIPLEEGKAILEAFTRVGTEKTRYRIPFGGNTWEVDVFAGPNQGLIVAEIELESETQTFEKPDWVSEEVSDDGRYTNAALAKVPFCTW